MFIATLFIITKMWKQSKMKVKSESEVPQPCPTLSYPMDCSPPGSSVYGIFQAGMEWGAIAFSAICTIYLQLEYQARLAQHKEDLQQLEEVVQVQSLLPQSQEKQGPVL